MEKSSATKQANNEFVFLLYIHFFYLSIDLSKFTKIIFSILKIFYKISKNSSGLSTIYSHGAILTKFSPIMKILNLRQISRTFNGKFYKKIRGKKRQNFTRFFCWFLRQIHPSFFTEKTVGNLWKNNSKKSRENPTEKLRKLFTEIQIINSKLFTSIFIAKRKTNLFLKLK